jgi:hypothetical protein
MRPTATMPLMPPMPPARLAAAIAAGEFCAVPLDREQITKLLGDRPPRAHLDRVLHRERVGGALPGGLRYEVVIADTDFTPMYVTHRRRLHRSLQHQTPAELAAKCTSKQAAELSL